MPQFPVSDQQGIIDGLNYVLSGPTATGQNFAGVSFLGDQQYDLTGNYRAPFAKQNFNSIGVPEIPLWVDPISISGVEFLNDRTIKITFATPFTPGFAPFTPGQAFGIYGTGITPADYDDLITNQAYKIGVIECNHEWFTMRLPEATTPLAAGTGGNVYIDSMGLFLSTDCNAKATVTSIQDRVVISSQINASIFTDAAFPGAYEYEVVINRYRAGQNFDPTNPDYFFNPDGQVAYKKYVFSNAINNPNEQETIFTSIIDNPEPGYYWYIMEVKFTSVMSGVVRVTNYLMNQRSFSVQVVKQ
jgi:hypothetical protein